MTATSPATLWRSNAWAQEHLGVAATTLRQAIKDSPAHITRAWANISSGKRPEYRWRSDLVDQWWQELDLWRHGDGSRPASIKSDGATPTGKTEPKKSTRAPRASRSSESSSDAKTSENVTSLAAYARSLRSKT